MSRLTIRRAAPAMQFQDLGRFGYSHMGLSQGGPLDLHAHCWANYLLDNKPTATTIEISYGNCALRAEVDCIIAITGAEMSARIAGEPVQNWTSHYIQKGETLQLNYAKEGIHSYLAIRHGFLAPKVLGSSATVVRNSIGELLKSETQVGYSYNTISSGAQRYVPHEFIPNYDSTTQLRTILPSHQDPKLSELIANTRFTISPQSDRMGINLTADPPLPPQPGIISEGIGLGTIQLPPSGHPIVLLNDRQTQGGYTKVGSIARLDLPLLTQAKPGTTLQLKPISITQATQEWAKFANFFQL